MTRMRGGSMSPLDSAPASFDVDRSQFHRPELPQNAPEVIVRNTVNITDSAYVLPWNRDERRRQFNLLVRRYKHQILYGCQESSCRTPTCLSYQKRVADGPFRRYTELSARTLACYLASLDNAEGGLCRNPPRLSSDFPPPRGLSRSKRRSPPPSGHPCIDHRDQGIDRSRGDSVHENHGTPVDCDSTSEDYTHRRAIRPSSDTNSAGDEEGYRDLTSGFTNSGTQKMKDPKSFTQNLFDTLALRMVEWLPLRRSHETFDSDRNRPTRHPSSRYASKNVPKAEQSKDQMHSSTNVASTTRSNTNSANCATTNETQISTSRSVNSQPTALELKLPGQSMKRLSLGEMEHWRQASRPGVEEKSRCDRISVRKTSLNSPSSTNGFVSLPSPPALRHRPQKHRGLDREMCGAYVKEEKKHPRVPWDDSKPPKEFHNEHHARTFPVQKQDIALSLPVEGSHPRRKSRHSKYHTTTSVQTVTHLSSEIVDGLNQMMSESEEDARKWKQEIESMELSGNLEDFEWQYATSQQRQVFPFVAQSIFYSLSNIKHLVCSFRQDRSDSADEKNGDTRSDIEKLEPSLRQLVDMCPWEIILHSLWSALEKLFVPPKELSTALRSSRHSASNSTSTNTVSGPIIPFRSSVLSRDEYVSDMEAAHIATVTLFTLVSSLPQVDAETWRIILHMRSTGSVVSDAEIRRLPGCNPSLVMNVNDRLEHELALRLINRLVRALTARLAFHEISKARRLSTYEFPRQREPSVLDLVLENLRKHHSHSKDTEDLRGLELPYQPPSASVMVVEWLRTLFLKEWDGKPEMARSTAAGGAVQILALMYKDRHRLGLESADFHTLFLSDRLDPMEMPVEWLETLSNNKTMHLLSYSFLFPPSALVIYFRALNYAAMSKSYEAAMTVTRHVTQIAFSSSIPIYDDVGLLARLRTSMSTYLVLVVRRDNVLTDALNQLWRREKRELMRPLKVQMGMEEGEEGVDHGGVQQEFFRVAFAEALNPTYGMFTMDARSHAAWFQSCSLEPLYKYELLGLLMSLAVYNGLTLPVNFPVALYRKLLGLKVKHLDHIQDGWPELAKGLEDLLRWEDGDVGDLFMRTYEFSFEVFGSVKTVDMEKVSCDAIWPILGRERAKSGLSDSSGSRGETPQHGKRRRIPMLLKSNDSDVPTARESFRTGILKGVDYNTPLMAPSSSGSKEASLVTNENREQFVKDYIFWLTDKSVRVQYEAFARGFYTCLDRPALSIFTPEALKSVVEGIQEIDIEELERHARYEGDFGPSHPSIRDFWHIVKQYSSEKKSRLLEFVTASDRAPVNGIGSIMFMIQKNGVGDVRLPTSLTCFGRLLLPEYSSRSVMQEKLGKALENARGFGVA